MKNDEQKLLDNMTGEDALCVLRELCATDPGMRKRIICEAQRFMADVDVDEVSEMVLSDLEALCVEDLWDRAGPSSRGYSSPDEMAIQMFEEALQPHEQVIEKFRRLDMSAPCMQYLMGTLKGIYRFEKDAKSEFKDWATDIPAETFRFLIDGWRKNTGKKDKTHMNKFITEQCPDWADLATKDRTMH